MRRGDVVIISEPGRLTGKPRPAVVIQSDRVNPFATRVTLALVGSTGPDVPEFRIPVAPDDANGLDRPSRIMADRVVTLQRNSIEQTVGRIDDGTMFAVDDALRQWLGL
jgi:mRNA interferase MazF